MKKTQRLLATAMTPFLIIQCLLTPLSVWADSLQVQPESTDYSVSAADSSEDEDIVLNDEQQGGVSMVLSTIAAFVFQHGPSGRWAPLLR